MDSHIRAQRRRRLHRQALLAFIDRPDEWLSGRELADRLGLDSTRELRREVIWPLRSQRRVPVHSKPGPRGGYKVNVTAEEHLDALTYNDQLGRDFLAIKSILRRESLDVVMGQMVLDFLPSDGDQADDGLGLLVRTQRADGRRVTWLDVLHRLLEVVATNPADYADEIDTLSRRFGGLFLSSAEQRAVIAQLRSAMATLSRWS